jgi:two-component system nitrate/nitrite response regulator NarL
MKRVTVALIDDQPLVVEGFKALCSRGANIELVAIARTTADVPTILKTHSPDLFFVEVANPENNIEDIVTVARHVPGLRLAALTSSRSMRLAIQTLDAGAHGYVLKQSPLEEIAVAAETLARGEKYISHCVATKLIAALQDVAARNAQAQSVKLSIREDQILRLLLAGKTNKAIASILSITENTVKHYMSILMQKLNARNRLEVVIAAQKLQDMSLGDRRVH